MTEERLASLNHSLTDGRTDKFGIGLRNVQERIRLHYGAGSRLTVSSRAGEGTTVTVRIAGLLRNGAGELDEQVKGWPRLAWRPDHGFDQVEMSGRKAILPRR